MRYSFYRSKAESATKVNELQLQFESLKNRIAMSQRRRNRSNNFKQSDVSIDQKPTKPQYKYQGQLDKKTQNLQLLRFKNILQKNCIEFIETQINQFQNKLIKKLQNQNQRLDLIFKLTKQVNSCKDYESEKDDSYCGNCRRNVLQVQRKYNAEIEKLKVVYQYKAKNQLKIKDQITITSAKYKQKIGYDKQQVIQDLQQRIEIKQNVINDLEIQNTQLRKINSQNKKLLEAIQKLLNQIEEQLIIKKLRRRDIYKKLAQAKFLFKQSKIQQDNQRFRMEIQQKGFMRNKHINRRIEISQKIENKIKINRDLGMQRRSQIFSEPNLNQLCQICYQKDLQFNFVTLNSCKDLVHIPCLRRYLESLVINNSNLLQIKCPIQSCKSLISSDQVMLFLKESHKKNYLKLTLQDYIAKNSNKQHIFYFCPTPDCQAVYQFDSKGISNCKVIYCRVCRDPFCTSCKFRAHPGKNCNGIKQQQEKMFQNVVKEKGFQKCYNCNKYIEKINGCDHMTCTCGAQFCYKCGKKMSQNCQHLSFQRQINPQLRFPYSDLDIMNRSFWRN